MYKGIIKSTKPHRKVNNRNSGNTKPRPFVSPFVMLNTMWVERPMFLFFSQ